MHDLEKNVFFKPTGAVQIANNFTLTERKLLNGIIWHSQKRRLTSDEKSLSVRDILDLLGLKKTENYEVVKTALRTLTSTIIEWNSFGEDKVHEWGICTFLSSGKIRAGKVIYRLNPEIVEKINHPTLFAKIQLLIQSQVKKKHGLVLYEFFLDSLSRARKESIKVSVELDKLYKLLGINPDMIYKFFNRDVLKPSLKEICKHTDIDVTFSTERQGRKVARIIFFVEKSRSYQLPIEFEFDEETEQSIAEQEELVALLTHRGIGIRKSKQLVKYYDAERIRENIKYVEKQQSTGKEIQNPKGYLVKAIEEDYRPQKSAKETGEDNTRKARQAEKIVKEREKTLEKEWKSFCHERTKEHFSNKPQEWQEERKKTFFEKIKNDAKKGNTFLYGFYKKGGFENAVVENCFFGDEELQKELLALPEEKSFDGYLVFQGIDDI